MEEEDVSSSPHSQIRIRGISPQLLALLPTFTNFLINRVWNHILLVLFAPDIFHGILVFFMTHNTSKRWTTKFYMRTYSLGFELFPVTKDKYRSSQYKKHISVNCHQLQSKVGFNWKKKYNFCGTFRNKCACYGFLACVCDTKALKVWWYKMA